MTRNAYRRKNSGLLNDRGRFAPRQHDEPTTGLGVAEIVCGALADGVRSEYSDAIGWALRAAPSSGVPTGTIEVPFFGDYTCEQADTHDPREATGYTPVLFEEDFPVEADRLSQSGCITREGIGGTWVDEIATVLRECRPELVSVTMATIRSTGGYRWLTWAIGVDRGGNCVDVDLEPYVEVLNRDWHIGQLRDDDQMWIPLFDKEE